MDIRNFFSSIEIGRKEGRTEVVQKRDVSGSSVKESTKKIVIIGLIKYNDKE